jgi:hypothetical protein
MIGPPCPQDPQHGRLVDLPGGKWYCPHSKHVGRAVYDGWELPEPWRTDPPKRRRR